MPGFLNNDESIPCKVVVNDQSQYSIWPLENNIPLGWRAEGFHGTKKNCLAYIEKVWVKM
jgi:MbtH protein